MGNSLERQKIKEAGIIITSFVASYEQMKKTKFTDQQNQQQSESSTSLSDVNNSLKFIANHLWSNEFKKLIKKPNFLHSLSALSLYKVGNHSNQEVYRLRLNVRYNSRWCLSWIQIYGDAQNFADLVNVGYGRVLSIAFCKAGGIGEEEDEEILKVLEHFSCFLGELHEGRYYRQLFFQPLPLLVRRTEEQMEEEGASEELEAQINNVGYFGDIKFYTNKAKAKTLNHFIHRR
ncbi:MAG: hypothetical protein EZS28_050189 [Streblomastix strix]|uniref:Uncharacterized protein n=1 Tax=Streblomastix strix TaxID=222440 RepID=A0A5J4T7D1_9EUKA|nr:MAG: hypothetical protein EZS28_050189 [Streblomastix strix]